MGDPGSVLQDDVHWLMARTARSLGVVEEAAIAHLGITLREYVILAEVAATPGRSQLAVARAAAVDKSLMVTAVDRLEAGGLLERTPDPNDRRVRALQLTPKGRRTMTQAARAVQQTQDRLLETLEPEQRAVFRAALLTLADSGPQAGFDTTPCV